ncbi:MAG TPA: NlpC/P60 family protein [Acidimicrobiales bacterium]|nr:NlpC/P60 family protein [Acidimicrobiales bacterium]
MRTFLPHRRRLGVLVGFALVFPVVAPAPVSGAPSDDKRAEAARIERQLEEQGSKVSLAAERYNRARLALDQVRTSIERARADLARADERMRQARNLMARTAVLSYVHGGSVSVLANLARSTNNDLVVRQQYLRFTAADQRQALGQLRVTREQVTVLRDRLANEERAAARAASAADAARREAAEEESAAQARLNRVKGEMANLVAAESARRAAAAATPPAPQPARPAAVTPAPTLARPSPLRGPSTPPPPAARGAAAAVAEAQRQIGKPYKWGGSGPDSFDCSGLTAWAWKAGGVTLSHSALAQYHETTRVPLSAIQPGDLVFFGPSVSGIHHNAIYVGNNQMIEASQTGTPVRYRAMGRRDLVGVGRPG